MTIAWTTRCGPPSGPRSGERDRARDVRTAGPGATGQPSAPHPHADGHSRRAPRRTAPGRRPAQPAPAALRLAAPPPRRSAVPPPGPSAGLDARGVPGRPVAAVRHRLLAPGPPVLGHRPELG